jgi:hypothetical protein
MGRGTLEELEQLDAWFGRQKIIRTKSSSRATTTGVSRENQISGANLKNTQCYSQKLSGMYLDHLLWRTNLSAPCFLNIMG